MYGHWITRLCGMLVLMPIALVTTTNAADPAPAKQRPEAASKVQKPKWNVGDQWTVETTSQQQQVSNAQQGQQRSQAIRWRFAVAGVEKIQQRACYRVEIRCLATGRRQPTTTLWVDQATMTLSQVQTQMPVAGGFRTVTESYRTVQGQASPVLPPLTVLPVDLPLLVKDKNTKGLGTFRYEAVAGLAGDKAIGDVRFATEVKQTITSPKAGQIKGLLGDAFSKSIAKQPVIEVKLQSHDRQVRQLWQQGRPWPVFADNGQTRARLVNVTPAGNKKPAVNKGSRNTKSVSPGSKALENAVSSVKPWSGYWWPIREGRMLVPLAKLDKLTGNASVAWERKHHPTKPDTPKWWGYCHAWSAAAVMEAEPNRARKVRLGTGQQISLSIGDQKALLTACHTRDVAHSYGDRYGDGRGSEDRQDLSPGTLWRLLKTYVKKQRVPLVLDVEAGPEVWNYPVFAYEIKYQARGNDGQQIAQLVLLMADDAVHPDYLGTKVRKQTYQFTFTMRDGAVVLGSGKWIGRSAKDHPDFAWYPYVAVAENPEVIYAEVKELVSGNRPSTPAEPEPQPEPQPQPTPVTPPVTQPVATVTPPVTQPQPTVPATQPTPQPATQSPPRPIVVSPMELVALIANKTSSFGLDITVDRFDGGSYKMGEQFYVRCASEKAGYLYLIQVDSQGNPSVLFPRPGEDNRVPVDKTVAIPSAKPGAGFLVVGPQGTTRVKAIVTTRPLAFTGAIVAPAQQQQKPEAQTQARQPAKLRIHPTQRQQIQLYLMKKPSELVQDVLGTAKPQDFLGPFAQDQVSFYTDKPQASVQQQKKEPQPKRNSPRQQRQGGRP